MKLRELYDAIGESNLSPDADVKVVESELGVVLEAVAPSPPSVVSPPAPEPAPALAPLKKSEPVDEDTDG